MTVGDFSKVSFGILMSLVLDTVISCCPLRWDSWETTPPPILTSRAEAQPPPPSVRYTPVLSDTQPAPASSRPQDTAPDDGHRNNAPSPKPWDTFFLKDNDSLNVHQAVMGYLKQIRRDPITDVGELCRVIVSSCQNVFDHYNTPNEYHFFDFVEHAIGQVVSHAARLPIKLY